MSEIDQKTLREIKDSLTKEKERIVKELVDIGALGPKRAEYLDLGDKAEENAQEVTVYSERLSLEHTLEKRLKDIDKALQKIEQGAYTGLCKYCKQPIPLGRILARPESNSCVECKAKLQGTNKAA